MNVIKRRTYRDVLRDRGIPDEQVVKRATIPARKPSESLS